MKSKYLSNEYKQLYPTGSYPSEFYGAAKIYKLFEGDKIDILPIRPNIFKMDTATYRLAKHLAKLEEEHKCEEHKNLKITKNFLEKIGKVKVAKGYQMISFDVKALFTNVPLEYTIDLVLKRIYENHETSLPVTRNERNSPWCTKIVHFIVIDIVYLQTNGVAVGSPLGPVMTGKFVSFRKVFSSLSYSRA